MRFEELATRIHVFYDEADGWGAIVTDSERFKHISGFGLTPLDAIHELMVAVNLAEEIYQEAPPKSNRFEGNTSKNTTNFWSLSEDDPKIGLGIMFVAFLLSVLSEVGDE